MAWHNSLCNIRQENIKEVTNVLCNVHNMDVSHGYHADRMINYPINQSINQSITKDRHYVSFIGIVSCNHKRENYYYFKDEAVWKKWCFMSVTIFTEVTVLLFSMQSRINNLNIWTVFGKKNHDLDQQLALHGAVCIRNIGLLSCKHTWGYLSPSTTFL